MANNIPILVHEQTPYLGVLSLGMQVGDMVRIKLQIQGFKNWYEKHLDSRIGKLKKI
jgi:hypothetical protein